MSQAKIQNALSLFLLYLLVRTKKNIKTYLAYKCKQFLAYFYVLIQWDSIHFQLFLTHKLLVIQFRMRVFSSFLSAGHPLALVEKKQRKEKMKKNCVDCWIKEKQADDCNMSWRRLQNCWYDARLLNSCSWIQLALNSRSKTWGKY